MEFESSPSTFEDLKNYLLNNKLMKLENGRFRISDEEKLKELGFGIFLSFFYSNMPPRRTWQFIKLDKNHVLFLVREEKFLPKISELKFIKNPFNGIPTGGLNCNLCPIKYWMLYNLCTLETDNDIKNDIAIEINGLLSGSKEKCHECKKDIIKWLKEKIKTNGVYGSVLGGNTYLLNVDSKFFEFFYSPDPEGIESYDVSSEIGDEVDLEKPTLRKPRTETAREYKDPTEILFNSFVVMYIACKTGCSVIGVNARMIKPFEAHEMDGYLWDPENKRLIVIETSREIKINKNHLKRKIYNSALMNMVDHSTYNYLYITFGNKSKDFTENVGHVRLVENLEKKYNVPFAIIDLPKKYHKAREKFDPKLLKEIYNHYITSIERLLKL